jgi:hypothetical protein
MHEAVLAGDGPAAAATVHYHADWSVGLIKQKAASSETTRSRRSSRPA